jgi:mono/diheme cytochrome c family protein
MTSAPSSNPPPVPPLRWADVARVWLAAWIVGGALLGAGALAVVEGGLFDTTATTPHGPLVAWATHTAFLNSVRHHARPGPPPEFTQSQVVDGFALYQAHCVMCHGGPGVARADWVAGMNPTPPYIIDAARRFTAPQLYWVVSRGVKMTGMPAWRGVESPAQTWDVVALLESLPYLSQDDYRRLAARRDAPAAPGR